MQSPVVQSAVPVAVAKCGNVKKRKKVFTVLLAAVFALMGGSILTLIALMAGIREISFAWNFIPFGCFAVAAVSMPVVMFQKNKYANLAALAERIESKDATVIASLSPVQTLPAFDAMKATVRAIIAGGALPDHEIVGEEVVARRSAGVTEDEARDMYAEYLALAFPAAAAVDILKSQVAAAPRYCPSCGAPVESEDAKFCSSCGVRLKGGEEG